MKYNPEIHNRRSIRLKGYDYSRAGLYFITICCDDRICRFGNIVVGAVGAGLAPAQTHDVARAQTPDVARAQTPDVAPSALDYWAGASPAPTVPTAQMILNEYGMVAYNEWVKLADRFHNVELDVFQIMPNHMHGIIILKNVVGAGFTPAQHDDNITPAQHDAISPNDIADIRAGVNPAPTISDIVGAYKSLVARGCLEIWKSKWTEKGPAPKMGKIWQRDYYEQIIRDEQAYQNISNYIIRNPDKWLEDKFFNNHRGK